MQSEQELTADGGWEGGFTGLEADWRHSVRVTCEPGERGDWRRQQGTELGSRGQQDEEVEHR